MEVIDGESFTLEAEINGLPVPNVKWYKTTLTLWLFFCIN